MKPRPMKLDDETWGEYKRRLEEWDIAAEQYAEERRDMEWLRELEKKEKRGENK